MTNSSSSKKSNATFAQYHAALDRELRAGIATEHTHRPALKTLIEQLNNVNATNEPKRSECGAPDYTVWRSFGHGPMTLGYIEAKDVGTALDSVERGEQMRRYLHALNNLILTDYLEFRWYLGGRWRRTERLATVDPSGHIVRLSGGQEAVEALLHDFLAREPGEIRQPKELAERMARLTHLIRDVIVESFEREAATKAVRDLRDAFSDVLIPDLSVPEFADMFAQTIAYGLFAARANHKATAPFRRHDAAYEIPRTNPFLRKLFGAITGPELDEEPYSGLVDDLTQLLAATDMSTVLATFGARTRRQDPVVHFYETFLAAYDPALREMRGVYYTPEPVVSYIVRSVDQLLRDQFACADGLAEQGTATYIRTDDDGATAMVTGPRLLVLDPACGTGTFLYSVIDNIREQFMERQDAGKWSGFVREQLLPRLFGFELLMAPYAVAHLKLGLQLAARDLPENDRSDWAYDFASDERLGVYLTNTLEEALKKSEMLLGSYISEEANAAAEIKRDLPIMVVLGNPPYSGISANRGAWIESLMEDYKTTVRSEERQIQRLSNDYAKFMRFAQWRIERTGHGILAFISDNGYLSNILFRDMRASLLSAFSDIYILDLHGVAVRGAERLTADENVFDIMQGVSIGIFVKREGATGTPSIYHADLFGTREAKYEALSSSDVSTTQWATVTPRAPHWRFVPTEEDDVYESWPSFPALIGTGDQRRDRDHRYGTGVKTRHDKFVVGWQPEDAVARVERIGHRSETDAELVHELHLCTTAHFNIQRARARAEKDDLNEHVQPVAFRPFDSRYVVYLREFVCEPKTETMRSLVSRHNLALAVLRRDRKELCTGYMVARGLVAKDMVSNLDDALIWPLYIDSPDELTLELDSDRVPNIAPEAIVRLSDSLGLAFVPNGRGDCVDTFGPEDFLSYVYAILYAPSYRARYHDFLIRDFPRIPLNLGIDLFRHLVGFGHELVELHLLESVVVSDPITHYPVPGPNIVEPRHPRYLAPGETPPTGGRPLEQGRVYISRDQYFEGVPSDVWEFQIGAYQVCEKWLKDRRARMLSHSDLDHYGKIIAALNETIRLMREIDIAISRYKGVFGGVSS